MNTTARSIALGGGIGAVIIAGAFVYLHFFNAPPQTQLSSTGEPKTETTYRNNEYGFSFSIPAGFSAEELPGVVVVYNEAGDGAQIVITPLDEDIEHLTEERIHADLPDLVINNPEVVEMQEGRTGLAFESNNEAFDGESQEVWFVFDKRLYQLNSYERLEPLLRDIVNTWEFF